LKKHTQAVAGRMDKRYAARLKRQAQLLCRCPMNVVPMTLKIPDGAARDFGMLCELYLRPI
jgi:hypothetical protein